MQSKVINLRIQLYEDWMKEMVAQLFIQEYKIAKNTFSQLFENFYEHPFQREKCIRIVALDDKKVVGFQSFFFWPYQHQGKIINTYQSGNSLVHPDYRGQGIFQKLLHHIDQYHEQLQVDCLIGFPIDVSIGSLKRNGWTNILNLNWKVRISNLFSVMRNFDGAKLRRALNSDRVVNSESIEVTTNQCIQLNNHEGFVSWRQGYSVSENYFVYVFHGGHHPICFDLKINYRKRFIKELIIGRISYHNEDESKLSLAISELCMAIKKSGQITLVSIGFNTAGNLALDNALQDNHFRKIKNEVFFCIKPFRHKELLMSPKNWNIYRGDIDTW